MVQCYKQIKNFQNVEHEQILLKEMLNPFFIFIVFLAFISLLLDTLKSEVREKRVYSKLMKEHSKQRFKWDLLYY